MEKWIYGGAGLARQEGRVIFTPFVLPGEFVRVAAVREKPGLVHARTLTVLTPSPERIDPKCPFFGRCGGCHYQHAPYDLQVELKCGILTEELRRLGKIEPPAEIAVVTAAAFGYRNRIQLHVANGRLGYQQAGSHKLCPITRCPVASPLLNEAITALVPMVRDSRWPRFVKAIELFTDERGLQLNVVEATQPVAKRFFEWCAEAIPAIVPAELDYEGRFRVSRHSFFQVNRYLSRQLVESALGEVTGESALDLYAGVGLFTLPMAGRFARVDAVESVPAAVHDLEFNAGRAGRANITAHRESAEKYLAALEHAPDFVLLDPPRAGMGRDVVRRLTELRPKQIAIVACDPATLARDLAGLMAAGYTIDSMTLVDLFPQTYHIETVVRLSAGPLPVAPQPEEPQPDEPQA